MSVPSHTKFRPSPWSVRPGITCNEPGKNLDHAFRETLSMGCGLGRAGKCAAYGRTLRLHALLANRSSQNLGSVAPASGRRIDLVIFGIDLFFVEYFWFAPTRKLEILQFRALTDFGFRIPGFRAWGLPMLCTHHQAQSAHPHLNFSGYYEIIDGLCCDMRLRNTEIESEGLCLGQTWPGFRRAESRNQLLKLQAMVKASVPRHINVSKSFGSTTDTE